MHQFGCTPSDPRCSFPNSPCWEEPDATLGRLVSLFPDRITYPEIDLSTFDRLHSNWFKRLDAAMSLVEGRDSQAREQFMQTTFANAEAEASDIMDHRLKSMFVVGTCRVVAWYAGIPEAKVRTLCADYNHEDAWACKQPPYYLYQCFEKQQ